MTANNSGETVRNPRHRMPPNAGKGRPKGRPNKATAEIKAASRLLVESPAYRVSLERRLNAGKAPHMETLLHYYAYGKPKDTVDMPAVADLAAALSRKVIDEIHPGPTKGSL